MSATGPAARSVPSPAPGSATRPAGPTPRLRRVDGRRRGHAASRASRASRAAWVGAERLERRALLAAVSWDGNADGDGDNTNWTDPLNCSNDLVPTAADDVTLNVAANPSIQINSGTQSVRSLVTNEGLTVGSGATLAVSTTADVNAALTLNGGTISGGAYDVTGGTLTATPNANNRLLNVAVNGDLNLPANGARVRIEGSTTFTAARLSGQSSALGFGPGAAVTGVVLFEGAGGFRHVEMNGTAGTLTIGTAGQIRTAPGFTGQAQVGPPPSSAGT